MATTLQWINDCLLVVGIYDCVSAVEDTAISFENEQISSV